MNTLQNDLEKEKMKMLSIVAFGCNRRAQSEFGGLVGGPFVYYEYFLSQPSLKGDDGKKVQNTAIYAPFLENVLRQFPFTPVVDESRIDEYLGGAWDNIQYVPTSKKAIRSFLPEIIRSHLFGESVLGWNVYIRWLANDCNPAEEKVDLQELLVKYKGKKNPADKVAAFKDFMVTCAPFLIHRIKSRLLLTCPLASEKVFYGTLLFGLPGGGCGATKKKDAIQLMKVLVNDFYVPVLTLFENYWEEFVLSKVLEENINLEIAWEKEKEIKISKNETERINLVFFNLASSSEVLERRLSSIWQTRRRLYTEKKTNALKEHLVFAKYNIASPKMLRIVNDIANANLRKSGVSLPSALVIGGPGSGKDSLARLIGLFSEEYTEGTFITINMASYKPEAISTPLLTGLVTDGIRLQGFFEKLVGKEKIVLILDELNSLDIDAQGALLRIIENSEVVPLGSIPERDEAGKKLDILVIGTMNEDPEKLTRETTLRQLTKDKLFGGALGEIFYDYVRSRRRLRDDLYYRLIRGGTFEVPELNERREDVPILFYVHAKQFAAGFEIVLDLDVYDTLMSEAINWDGNVRQLQAVTKKIIDEKIKKAVGDKLELTTEDVQLILRRDKMYSTVS